MKALIMMALATLAAPAIAEPLVFDNGRLFIGAQINGVPTEALLDSAAEATLIDPAFAARAKLPAGSVQEIRGSGGTASAGVVEGVTIEALGVQLHPDSVEITDLTELSKWLIKRPTAVVVGRELFDAARLRIDIGGRRIDVANSAVSPPGRRLALTSHAGVEAITVSANGRRAQAEFDLGNGSDVLISRSLVRRLHLKVTGQKRGGGIGGALTRDLVMIRSLSVAGRHFANVTAAVDDQPNADELNIGTAILKHFLITTDYRARSVWLKANAP